MQVLNEWLPASGRAEQLILLLHGWASRGAAMAPLALALRAAFPQAAVVAPDAPNAADGERPGHQWYSIFGLDEGVWEARVAALMPTLRDWVQAQQQRLEVGPQATAIGGFSQGAILSLVLATRHDGIAGRVLAFGGRYPRLPDSAPKQTTVHLFHGGADKVIPVQGSRDALERLGALHGDATVDIAEGIGHELHPVLIDCALQRLRNHIPLRTWQAALGAVPSAAERGAERDAELGIERTLNRALNDRDRED